MPDCLELTLSDQIYIRKEELSPSLRNRLLRVAAFQNPEFYRAQAMRMPTYDKPRVIGCAEETSHYLCLPRGCFEETQEVLISLNIGIRIRDERCTGQETSYKFVRDLSEDQRRAVESMKPHDIGALCAPPAFRKTVLASWLIAHRARNTLVIVHRKQLLDQWIARRSEFLGLSRQEIGAIGGRRKKFNGVIDVALIQSLVRGAVVKDEVAKYGFLIVDECHHISARSFELALRRVKAKFILGLSRTLTRKDGKAPIIFMQCGPVRLRVEAKHQARKRPFAHHVIVRPTAFVAPTEEASEPRVEFQTHCATLISDTARNDQICNDVIDAVNQDRTPVVLTERVEHLEELANRLRSRMKNVIVLRGGMGAKALELARERLASIPSDESRALLATGRYLGERFDDSRLDTLFLTMPISWSGTIAQYAGRLHRIPEGKREVLIYDYADLHVPMLSRMFDKHCRGYEAIGYTILIPASALPGWPTEVFLPVDPQRKKEYAASVRRLIRDGVDARLAVLFSHATRSPRTDTIGIERARSASEAFLFQRLESLRETQGRFCLNATLPIPFNDEGSMEVDFLCADQGLVVEIDGDPHLGDRESYRRDRRKDHPLQENGYVVLRFLASDLGKELGSVLDSILRAISNRKNNRTF